MKMVTRVQILDESIYISYRANNFREMYEFNYSSFTFSWIDWLFNLCMATSYGKWKLWTFLPR